MTKGYTFLAVIVILGCSTVEALNCYQCNSNNNSACKILEDNGKVIKPKPCPLGYGFGNNTEPYCRKTTLWYMDFDRNDILRVIRSCGYIKSKYPCYSATNDGHEEIVCQCFEDECNTSSLITATKMIVLTLSILTVLYSYM